MTFHRALFILKPLICGCPSFIVGYVALPFGFLPYHSEVLSFLKSHQVVATLLVLSQFFILFIWDIILAFLNNWKNSLILNLQDLTYLFTALDRVVGEKSKRFYKTICNLKTRNNNISGEEIFRLITQPRSQMESLLKELHHFLNRSLNDDKIKIVLAKVRPNGVPTEWFVCIPADDVPSDSILNSHNSFFQQCAKSKKPEIMSNIEKDKNSPKNQYLDTGFAFGSIICIPIYFKAQKRVKYVLSVKSDKINLINKSFHKKNKIVFDSINKRLVLEDNLQVLKSLAQGANE